jgi:putative heme-binding domain-containing protein
MANASTYLHLIYSTLFLSAALFIGCGHQPDNQNTNLEEVAGSDEALDFMKTFAGRGVLSDSSEATPPEEVLSKFHAANDLALDLALSEPAISQPVFLNFDHRGRLWVVQYNQYPYPKGVKVLSMDQHIRARFDKVPEPPPLGVKGADKISFFEDTDGDGIFDNSTDVITGLNIATSVALGRGKIWVLAPPYLLAYADVDNNGLPEGNPEVHLKGFGIEDTHAVANNLRWGPDGWLYGAQGSTCTANVSSSASKNVSFDGQAIWRYHPESHLFEIFAEGGGNTFDVEIDDKGRIFSGDNGITRGRYYKQGSYHIRNLGKHGAFTNPYALGYLEDMELKGEKVRFTHAFIRYQEQGLPASYYDRMISINPMQNLVQLSSLAAHGSTFSVVDEARILQTEDHWFRPVDITTGPDGSVYIADWYDSRLSHVDPRDTWSKGTGRVYRLRNKNKNAASPPFDISKYSNEQLIQLLLHPSRWYRQQAQLELGNRKDITVVPKLKRLMTTENGQTALEAFWAIALSGGFTDSVAMAGIQHRDPFVRMWAVRLLGDANKVSPAARLALAELSSTEQHPEVRSQLAATAKRLHGSVTLMMIRNLLKNHDDVNDPDVPLQIWWAIESKSLSDREALVTLFEDAAIWSNQTVVQTVLARLMQRWIMEGGAQNYVACARLLTLSPSRKQAKPLINGIQEGLRGRDITALPSVLANALKPYQSEYENESLAIALHQGQREAITNALKILADHQADVGERLMYIRIFGEINQPESVPVLLKLVESRKSSDAIRQASLKALARYDDPEIGARVTKAYPDILRSDPNVKNEALSLLALRTAWAVQLLNAIDRKTLPGEKFIAHTIDKADVPQEIVRHLILLGDPAINETAYRLWPGVRLASSAEINKRVKEVSRILESGSGDLLKGRLIFNTRCGSCHRLFEEGAEIGPDLTGYDRKNINEMLTNIIDPNAYIREGYGTFHITTTDKRSIVGTLKAKNGSMLTIQPFHGDVITLSSNQVEKMVEQKTSIMPEGLLDGLSDQQIRDIFAYITK